MSVQNQKPPKTSLSLFRHFGTGTVNLVIVIILGYIGLFLVLGGLSLILPEPIEMNSDSLKIFESFYQAYVVAWGFIAILSFFTAFTGFSIVGKIKNWRISHSS